MDEENLTATKLKQLSQKISSLSFSVDKQQQIKMQAIQQHLRKVQDDFSKQRPIQQSKLQLLKDQITRSSEIVRGESTRANSKSTILSQKITSFKSGMQQWIQNQRTKQLTEKDQRAEVNNNELMALCEMIQKQQSHLYDKFQQSYENINMKVNVLKQELHREQTDRENNVIRIADSMETELEKFKQAIQLEANQRQQSQTKIKIMIGEIRGKLSTEIEKQVKRRTECNNLMLQLLETACQKMEKRK